MLASNLSIDFKKFFVDQFFSAEFRRNLLGNILNADAHLESDLDGGFYEKV